MDWLYIYTAYDKRHNTSTLSCPLHRSLNQSDSKVLLLRFSFDGKITDVDHFYELKCRLCADGWCITEGTDFETSYGSTADDDALRIIISRTTLHNLRLYFYDVSNVFQTNIIEDPSKRYYLSLPPLYNQWFSQRLPNHYCWNHVQIGRH